MALGDHLRELRTRVLISAVAIVVGAIGAWFLYDPVFALLQQPVEQIIGGGAQTQLNFTTTTGAFDTKVRVTIILGTFLACPVWLYEIWAFLAPGLTRKEKWGGAAFVLTGIPLFLGGAYVAWLVLPAAVRILTSVTPDGVWNLLSANEYLMFVMQLMLIFGIAFLLPLIMVALTALGLVTSKTWAKGWRWAVVVIFVFAAVATPSPDVASMIFMAVPMLALYGLALLISMILDRRRAKRIAAEEAELGIAD